MTTLQTIATKISPEMRARRDQLLQARGLTLYDYLQLCCEVAVTYMDTNQPATNEMQRLMRLFEGAETWNNVPALTAPDGRTANTRRIEQAVYFIIEKGKRGTIPVLVTGRHNDLFRETTYNKIDIIERTLEAVTPFLYRKLRSIGVDMGTNSILETLTLLVDEQTQTLQEDELRHIFGANDYITGKDGTARSQADHTRKAAIRKRDLTNQTLQ